MSVGYDLYLSKWFGDAMPISDQASHLLRSLRLASLGNKPTIFVAHSFGMVFIACTCIAQGRPCRLMSASLLSSLGGLIVKEMLRLASKDERYKSVVDNTVGVIFYSTPHLGVEHTKYATPAINSYLFRYKRHSFKPMHYS